MSSSNTGNVARELLTDPNQSSPAFSNAPGNTPDTAPLTNVVSGPNARTDTRLEIADQSPNPQSTAIFIPVQNQALQKTIQDCIDHLSDDDKVAFQSATDVVDKLGELKQGTSHISISHPTCMERVQKVQQCVKQFLGSISICIQHNSEISLLGVGGLRCILTVSTTYSASQNALRKPGQ